MRALPPLPPRPRSPSLGRLLIGLARPPLPLLLGLDPVGLALLQGIALLVEVGAEVVDHLPDRLPQRLLVLIRELAGLVDPVEQVLVLGVEPGEQIGEELGYPLGLDPVQIAAGAGVDRGDLLGHVHRLALLLVERLDHSLTAAKRRLSLGIELGAELGEGLELPVLGEVEPQPPGHLLHRLGLGVAADPRDRGADVDRRAYPRVEEIGLEEYLSVGDRDHVGRDIGRDVAGLGLDHRQRGQRARTLVVGELHRPLEQPRMEVEDIARVGLAAGRTAEQQRHLPVGRGVLGEVVVDAECVLSLVQEVLAHRATRVGSDVLDRRRLVGGGGDDDRRVHCPGLLQGLHHLDHRGHPLPDRDVDADQVGILVVDDRVDRDRGLSGLAVADDQLALTAADRDHRVDRLEPGLHRLLNRLAMDDARSLELRAAGLAGVDVALVVERPSERIDEAAEQLLAHRDLQQPLGPPHRVAFGDLVPLAEEHSPDVVLLQVEGQPDDVVRQVKHLQRHAVVDAMDAGDPVADLEHGPDLGEVRRPGLHSLDPLAQD